MKMANLLNRTIQKTKNGGLKEDFKGATGGTLRVLLKVLPTAKFSEQSGQNTKSRSIFRGHSFLFVPGSV